MDFDKFLIEADKADKNLHLTHIDEDIVVRGVSGARDAINFVRAIRDMLAGTTDNPIKITTKFDGAPSIFCGINPENDKFFVATKSIFNVSPKLNYTPADIDINHPSDGLNKKLKIALKYLPALHITGILQGDMMYTKSDLYRKEIEPGTESLCFQPNTLIYAIPYNSDLAKRIAKTEMGIVFHTEYKGKTLSDMKASFNVNVNSLKNSEHVWFRDASFIDAAGTATFTQSETDHITELLKQATDLFKGMDSRLLNFIANNDSYKSTITVFINKKIRAGTTISSDSKKTVKELQQWSLQKINAAIIEAKKPDNKARKELEKQVILKFYSHNFNGLVSIFDFINIVTECKNMIIAKLQQIRNIGTFLPSDQGYKVTAPEGFVAINHDGKAIKLVDRLTFSHANFTATRDWVK